MQNLEEDDDVSYLSAAWANPKAFRSEVAGLGGSLQFKPF